MYSDNSRGEKQRKRRTIQRTPSRVAPFLSPSFSPLLLPRVHQQLVAFVVKPRWRWLCGSLSWAHLAMTLQGRRPRQWWGRAGDLLALGCHGGQGSVGMVTRARYRPRGPGLVNEVPDKARGFSSHRQSSGVLNYHYFCPLDRDDRGSTNTKAASGGLISYFKSPEESPRPPDQPPSPFAILWAPLRLGPAPFSSRICPRQG